ncbi:MAG: hypothetical protein KGZ69_08225 [Methylomonas sp.]|nr:hypothetical protein [Methylomonas sp.]
MNARTQQQFVEELLGDEFTKMVLKELGIENSSPAVQTELLGRLGSCIMQRLALEILSVIPKSDHETFAQLITSNDPAAMRAFLEPRIADLDEFLTHYATSEYEAIKSLQKSVEAGVA